MTAKERQKDHYLYQLCSSLDLRNALVIQKSFCHGNKTHLNERAEKRQNTERKRRERARKGERKGRMKDYLRQLCNTHTLTHTLTHTHTLYVPTSPHSHLI